LGPLKNPGPVPEVPPGPLSMLLTFVLPTEKRLVVSFWTLFKYLGKQGELKKTKSPIIFVNAGVSFLK